MYKFLKNTPYLLLAVSCLFLLSGTTCMAQADYTNPETGYQVIIEDDADLLTPSQEDDLADEMKEITRFGHALFKTIDQNTLSAEEFARNFYRQTIDTESGTLFLIDMDNRMLWIHSDGDVYKTITTSYANTITDNVYRDASKKDYYTCASTVFSQINTLLAGNHILQPMKYTSNLLLALILALLITFLFVSSQARLKKPKQKELMSHIDHYFNIRTKHIYFSHISTVYSPESSGGSSFGGGGGGSSSGGGGSSSSGGGGGHRF